MSESEAQITDILLPQASIAVFSNDEETLGSAASLRDDWRYARVTVNEIKGGVDQAIATYQSATSPDLMIIQTEDIDDSFTAKLGELSQYCDEGTSAIIIGPVNDVYLYRQLIEMGVSDYLVRPIKPKIFGEVIAKALVDRLGVSDSRLIVFASAHGGVGTTTLSQISALISSSQMGQKTMLMDMCGGWSSLSVGLGFEPSATLQEVYKAIDSGSEDTLKRMIHNVDDKLSVVSTGSDSMLDQAVTAAVAEAILDNLMSVYPIVFVDLSGADSVVKKAVLARANQIVLVTTPTVTSLRSCRSLLSEISDVRGESTDDVSLLVNKSGVVKSQEVSRPDITEAIGCAVDADIPYMPEAFLKYESEIKNLMGQKEGDALLEQLVPILMKSISVDEVSDGGDDDKKSGFLGGFLSKLGSK